MRQKLSGKLLTEWQIIVDLVARIADVPVGLIMRLHEKDLEVLVSSKTEGNPYHVGEKDCVFGSGLYCEKVIESQKVLLVPNALKSAQWNSNPDLKHNLISYLGFPIRLPDGEAFGTICLLDRKENHYSEDVIALLEKMRSLIEDQLQLQDLLVQNIQQMDSIHKQNCQMEKLYQALKQSEEKYRFITENALDFIWVYNINQNKFLYASPGVERMCGYSGEAVLARGMEGVVMPEFLDGVKQRLQEAFRKLSENPALELVSQNEIQQQCSDGSAVWVEYTVKYRVNENGEIEAVGISRNIEERKRKEQEIYHLSTHDCLTAIYNCAYFYERAKEEIAKADRYQQPLAMLFLDVDHFKSVNDRFGHAVGDEVLKNITAAVEGTLRKSDIFARYGGEEFVVLLPESTLAAACSAAEKICRAVEKAKPHQTVKITVSLGVTERKAGESLDEWSRRTDAALYRAKENGRNCFVAE